MSERIAISRDGMELGTLTRSEAAELLQAGFLRATDLWRPETSMAWLPLTELVSNSALPLTESVKKKLSGAGQSITGGATQVASRLKSLVSRSQNQLTMSSRQLLDASLPQLRKLVALQLIKQPVESVRGALGDEKFTRKFFGAIYDCLPKPICRFVTEAAFVEFCLERKDQLFASEAEESPSNRQLPGESNMKTIAIIGASNDRAKFGNKAVRAFLQQGYEVFPVNPKAETIEGLRAFKSITDVPVRPHLVSVYLPPPILRKVLPDIAAKGCDEFWLNPGTESDEVLAESERLGLNVIQACSIVGIGVSPAEL